MARFTPKVLRLLPVYLTDVVLREIDALFEDNDVELGPPQTDPNDTSERRERVRRYLATLDLNSPDDHAKLVAVYSDLTQEIGQRKEGGDYYDLAPLRAKWMNTLKAAGFEIDPWSFVVTDPERPQSLGFAPEALAALSTSATAASRAVPAWWGRVTTCRPAAVWVSSAGGAGGEVEQLWRFGQFEGVEDRLLAGGGRRALCTLPVGAISVRLPTVQTFTGVVNPARPATCASLGSGDVDQQTRGVQRRRTRHHHHDHGA